LCIECYCRKEETGIEFSHGKQLYQRPADSLHPKQDAGAGRQPVHLAAERLFPPGIG
jgi:hypothetical protein